MNLFIETLLQHVVCARADEDEDLDPKTDIYGFDELTKSEQKEVVTNMKKVEIAKFTGFCFLRYIFWRRHSLHTLRQLTQTIQISSKLRCIDLNQCAPI